MAWADGTPASAERRIPLTQLPKGARALVECSALEHLPERERCLLAAMGMGEACKVRVCRPGAPCIIQVDQTRIGLAREVADKIMVVPIDPV